MTITANKTNRKTSGNRGTMWQVGSLLLSAFCLFQAMPAAWFAPEQKPAIRCKSDHLRVLTFESPDGKTQTIKSTNGHPFWSVDRQAYIKAQSLSRGDRFRTLDGSIQRLKTSIHERHPEGGPVYNVEVESLHNYFVARVGASAGPTLAHNTCDLDDAEFLAREIDDLRSNQPPDVDDPFPRFRKPWDDQHSATEQRRCKRS